MKAFGIFIVLFLWFQCMVICPPPSSNENPSLDPLLLALNWFFAVQVPGGYPLIYSGPLYYLLLSDKVNPEWSPLLRYINSNLKLSQLREEIPKFTSYIHQKKRNEASMSFILLGRETPGGGDDPEVKYLKFLSEEIERVNVAIRASKDKDEIIGTFLTSTMRDLNAAHNEYSQDIEHKPAAKVELSESELSNRNFMLNDFTNQNMVSDKELQEFIQYLLLFLAEIKANSINSKAPIKKEEAVVWAQLDHDPNIFFYLIDAINKWARGAYAFSIQCPVS